MNKNHGAPTDEERHIGSLGNIILTAGQTEFSFDDPIVQLQGEHSIAGRSFVLHQYADDLGRGTGAAEVESLKSGNAGPPLACGTIFLKSGT